MDTRIPTLRTASHQNSLNGYIRNDHSTTSFPNNPCANLQLLITHRKTVTAPMPLAPQPIAPADQSALINQLLSALTANAEQPLTTNTPLTMTP